MEIQYEDLMHRLEELGDLIHEKKTGDLRPDILGAKFTMVTSALLLNRIRELEAEVEKLKKKEEIKE